MDRIRHALGGMGAPLGLRRVAEIIRSARGYGWVGIYRVDREEIAAVAWTGDEPPAHLRFPVTQGLCGAAVESGAPVIVGEVSKDPRYLTTFGTTRSEIVVPIVDPAGFRVAGLIDVESERRDAFTQSDQGFLQDCAAALVGALS